jgi:dUTP pyrophosphatase
VRLSIKIKRLEHAKNLPIPSYATEGSSGIDLYAAVSEPEIIKPGEFALIPTGICVEIPQGFEAQIRPRSGLAMKYGLSLLNTPGTIDSDYRGEVGIILINFGKEPVNISRGHRIAQMIFSKIERVTICEVDNLESTNRGPGGFGHTGM